MPFYDPNVPGPGIPPPAQGYKTFDPFYGGKTYAELAAEERAAKTQSSLVAPSTDASMPDYLQQTIDPEARRIAAPEPTAIEKPAPNTPAPFEAMPDFSDVSSGASNAMGRRIEHPSPGAHTTGHVNRWGMGSGGPSNLDQELTPSEDTQPDWSKASTWEGRVANPSAFQGYRELPEIWSHRAEESKSAALAKDPWAEERAKAEIEGGAKVGVYAGERRIDTARDMDQVQHYQDIAAREARLVQRVRGSPGFLAAPKDKQDAAIAEIRAQFAAERDAADRGYGKITVKGGATGPFG